MDRTKYTGNINDEQTRGKGKGERMIWAGSRYDYLCDCGKKFKSYKKLDEHRQYEECEILD